MPVLGFDMVVKCRYCAETTRMRVISGADPAQEANPFRMMAELTDSGFEMDEDGEYLCFRHGSGRYGRAPAPHPELVRVLKK